MGIKLVNKFASAALVLSFCGALSVSAYAQEFTAILAAQKHNNFLNTKFVDGTFKPETTVKSESRTEAKTATKKSPARRDTYVNDPNPWTGFYVGGFIGSNHGRSSTNTSTVYSSTGYFAQSSVNAINSAGAARQRSNGFSGGFQGGYNFQRGNFVYGVEGDFAWNRKQQDSISNTVYPCCSPDRFVITDAVKTGWMMTARPRVGYAYDRALFYITGGLAVANIEHIGVFTDSFDEAMEGSFVDKTRAGWTGGGGIEYKIAKRWSAKAEYLYSDFGRISRSTNNLATFNPADTYPENPFTRSLYVKNHGLRFGVNFHF